MAKVSVENMDPDVCMGRRDDVSGVCPKLVDADADTGRSLVDRLAKAESAAIGALKGGDGAQPHDFKCEPCGCPLPNLEVFGQVPDVCPRQLQHNQPER